MAVNVSRREIVGAMALPLAYPAKGRSAGADSPVRIGVVGTGGRGTSLIRIAASMPGVEFPALCDIDPRNLARAQDFVMTSGRKKPEGYTGEEDYRRLMARDDLDGVIIATPWEWHTPMAVFSMQAGKFRRLSPSSSAGTW